jgi:chromosome segregation ATPase
MNTLKAPLKSNGPPPSVVPPTPEELAVHNAVQHHVASYQRLQTERDELRKFVDRLEQGAKVDKIEIESLRVELSTAQSRIASYQHERDDAVANLAVYQSLYISIMAQLRAFGIEHAPLIKEAGGS